MNEQQFDKFLHINTVGEQYGFPKLAHYHRYEPTPYTGLEQLFSQYEMPKNPVFIDMGCGKGRVPIYIHHKFHIPTIGVEMDAGFYKEAEHNKESYCRKKGSQANISFVHTIAENYNIQPSDNVFSFLIHFPLIYFVRLFIIYGSLMSNRCAKSILFYTIRRTIICSFYIMVPLLS